MSRLAKLDSLNITGSSVSVLPSSMEHCVSLRELYANPMYSKAAPLSGNLNLIMKNMQDLKYVEIGECALTGDLSVLRNKKNLKSFVLFDLHKLSGDLNLGENLVGCDSLTNLNLGSSPELTGTLKGFPTAPLLENFVLMDSKVGGSLEDGQFHTVAVERVKLWMPNNEFTGNVPADFTKKLMSANIAMNKLSGTLPQNIADSIIKYFTYGDRICVQKEGFGFTNCKEE